MKSDTSKKTTSRAKATATPAKATPAAKSRGMTPKAGKTPATKKRAEQPPSQPTHDEITRRAYEIYLKRGQAPGNAVDDWTQAERELLAERHRNN